MVPGDRIGSGILKISLFLIPVVTVRADFPHTATPSIGSVRPFAPLYFYNFTATMALLTSYATSVRFPHLRVMPNLLTL